jgi:2-phosphoglycerate kinase
VRVILIGGSSHAGKSTIAQTIAAKLGWSYLTTDHVARHPGRPWRTIQRNTIPEHVVEHYSTLAIDELFTDVLKHYRRIWPDIVTLITTHASDVSAEKLVLEGSAIWPEFVAATPLENVKSIWLTASDELFQKRIYAVSNYAQATAQERLLIQKFLDRTILYNQKMLVAIRNLGLPCLEVNDQDSPGDFADRCLEILTRQVNQ